jgi:hypothetical protein
VVHFESNVLPRSLLLTSTTKFLEARIHDYSEEDAEGQSGSADQEPEVQKQ